MDLCFSCNAVPPSIIMKSIKKSEIRQAETIAFQCIIFGDWGDEPLYTDL